MVPTAKRIWSGLTSIFAIFLCLTVIGSTTATNYASSINAYLGITTSMLVENEDGSGKTIAYESSFGELSADNLKPTFPPDYNVVST